MPIQKSSQKLSASKAGRTTRTTRAATIEPPHSPASSIASTKCSRPRSSSSRLPKLPTRQSARIRGQSTDISLPDTAPRKRKASSTKPLDPIEYEEHPASSPSKKVKLEHDSEDGVHDYVRAETGSAVADISSTRENTELVSRSSSSRSDIDLVLETQHESDIQDAPRSPIKENIKDDVEQSMPPPRKPSSQRRNIRSPVTPEPCSSFDQDTEDAAEQLNSSLQKSSTPGHDIQSPAEAALADLALPPVLEENEEDVLDIQSPADLALADPTLPPDVEENEDVLDIQSPADSALADPTLPPDAGENEDVLDMQSPADSALADPTLPPDVEENEDFLDMQSPTDSALADPTLHPVEENEDVLDIQSLADPALADSTLPPVVEENEEDVLDIQSPADSARADLTPHSIAVEYEEVVLDIQLPADLTLHPVVEVNEEDALDVQTAAHTPYLPVQEGTEDHDDIESSTDTSSAITWSTEDASDIQPSATPVPHSTVEEDVEEDTKDHDDIESSTDTSSSITSSTGDASDIQPSATPVPHSTVEEDVEEDTEDLDVESSVIFTPRPIVEEDVEEDTEDPDVELSVVSTPRSTVEEHTENVLQPRTPVCHSRKRSASHLDNETSPKRLKTDPRTGPSGSRGFFRQSSAGIVAQASSFWSRMFSSRRGRENTRGPNFSPCPPNATQSSEKTEQDAASSPEDLEQALPSSEDQSASQSRETSTAPSREPVTSFTAPSEQVSASDIRQEEALEFDQPVDDQIVRRNDASFDIAEDVVHDHPLGPALPPPTSRTDEDVEPNITCSSKAIETHAIQGAPSKIGYHEQSSPENEHQAAPKETSHTDRATSSLLSEPRLSYAIPASHRRYPNVPIPEIDYDDLDVNVFDQIDEICDNLGFVGGPSSRNRPFFLPLTPDNCTPGYVFTKDFIKYDHYGQKNVVVRKESVRVNNKNNADTCWAVAKLFADYEKNGSVDATEIIQKLDKLTPTHKSPAALQSSSSAALLGLPTSESSSSPAISRRSSRPSRAIASASQQTQAAAPYSGGSRKSGATISSDREHLSPSFSNNSQSADFVHSRLVSPSKNSAGLRAPSSSDKLANSVNEARKSPESRGRRASKDPLKSVGRTASSAPNFSKSKSVGTTAPSSSNSLKSVGGLTRNSASVISPPDDNRDEPPLIDDPNMSIDVRVARNTVRECMGYKGRYIIPPEYQHLVGPCGRPRPSTNDAKNLGNSGPAKPPPSFAHPQRQMGRGSISRSPVKKQAPRPKPMETSNASTGVSRNNDSTFPISQSVSTAPSKPVSSATSKPASATTSDGQPKPRYKHIRKHMAGAMDRGYFHIGPELFLDTGDEWETEWEGEDGVLVEPMPKSAQTAVPPPKPSQNVGRSKPPKIRTGYGLCSSSEEDEEVPEPVPAPAKPPAKLPLKSILKKTANKYAIPAYGKKSVTMVAPEKETGPLTETFGNKRPHAAAFGEKTPEARKRPNLSQPENTLAQSGPSADTQGTGPHETVDSQVALKPRRMTPGTKRAAGAECHKERLRHMGIVLPTPRKNAGTWKNPYESVNHLQRVLRQGLNTSFTSIRQAVMAAVLALPEEKLNTAEFEPELKNIEGSGDDWIGNAPKNSRPGQ